MMPAEIRDQVPFISASGGGFILGVIFAPVYIIIGLFIWSAILHLCMVIVGGLQKSVAGFEGSFRVVSYAMVAQLANVVPVIGDLLGFVWTLVLVVIGLQKLHDAEPSKAVLAVLIPVLLCCVCVGVMMMAGFAGLMTMFANQ